MRKQNFFVLGFVSFAIIAVIFPAPSYAVNDVFVVSSSQSGDTNFLVSNGDGTFGGDPPYEQEILMRARDFDFDVRWDISFGNGLGDFDGDGDMDYVMAIGFGTGKIYIYEKTGAGNQFAKPLFVDTWGKKEGRYPMDMAVADFDGDDDLDFVLTLGNSTACGLYANIGMFEFESKLLPDTAPDVSFGADAADFDNDGDADFIVAAGSDGLFYVNLNDNDHPGTFSTYKFESAASDQTSGVAAADFTGDGIVDIVAGAPGFLDVYQGTGDGKTFTHVASYAYPINPESAIDNYDFDGDGNQDLVIANYADDGSGVVVMLGRGDLKHPDGLFFPPDIYLGGTGSALNAISGPPYRPVSNKKPVAIIEPEYLEVTVGEEIQFDGSNSFDEDGQIVSYEWDFGDSKTISTFNSTLLVQQPASRLRVKNDKPSHTYAESGSYRVTLWVTDDQGATSDIQAEVVVKSVQARVKFYPRRLYLGSRGKYLWAKITFPKGFDARNVDESTLCIVPDKARPIFAYQKASRSFFDRIFNKLRKRKKWITVRFDRQAVLATFACPPEKRSDLKIQGDVFQNNRWVEFKSTGSIRTKMRKRFRCDAN